MRPFAAIERFFERLFERPSARLFHTRVQPIQLQRRVERAMENGRLSTADRVVVPNRYLVRLAATDMHAFGDLADSLEVELADAALKFARAHRYAVSDRPAVRLLADPKLDEGDVQVDASFSDAPFVDLPDAHRASSAPPTPKPTSAAALSPDEAPAAGGIRAAGHPRDATGGAAPARTPASGAPPPPLALPSAPSFEAGAPVRPNTSAGLARLDNTRTMIFEVPTVDAPLVVLREVAPDGSQRELTLDGGPVTIGRANDNNLVLNDSRVSRYHARLAARAGAMVYRDLGSTNGSRVNGVEIDEVVLGAGDRIELGDTVLVVESVAGA